MVFVVMPTVITESCLVQMLGEKGHVDIWDTVGSTMRNVGNLYNAGILEYLPRTGAESYGLTSQGKIVIHTEGIPLRNKDMVLEHWKYDLEKKIAVKV